MKRIAVIIVLVSCSLESAYADERPPKRFTFGAEWEYMSSFHYGFHHNFFSQEGYRVDINHSSFGYEGNGGVYLHCGYNVRNSLNISLYSGFMGIYDLGRAIPISIRVTGYFNENARADRWLGFIEAGSGVNIKKNPQMLAIGKVGGGYRISLSQTTKLDLLVSYRMSLTHPYVIYDGYEVQHEMINRNNAYVSALTLGISLTL